VALDALQALRDLGYDVPTDVWLSGFDDSGESRTCMPALTTVHIHTQIMAYMAVELLRTRIIEPSLDYRQVYTETNLRYRDSTPLS
jgi:LacI family transcriptional regulator